MKRFVCDSCDSEVTGFTKVDLINDGWRWRPIKGRKEDFILCGECNERFKALWKRKAA